MIQLFGNMWDIFVEADIFIFTGNSYVRKDGALVMGRGLALDIRDKIPELAYILGDRIKESPKYGLIIEEDLGLGVFQVKYHFSDNADLDLIRFSCGILSEYANTHLDKKIHMNYPGIGYGHLSRESVEPIIRELPDNVHVWSFK